MAEAKKKRIEMLDTCEDTNGRPVSDGKGGYKIAYATDLLRAGEQYEVPVEQADNLIKIGLAKAVKGGK